MCASAELWSRSHREVYEWIEEVGELSNTGSKEVVGGQLEVVSLS